MAANDSWVYQGRQEHGWFGDGTSPENARDDAAGNPRLFLPENAGNRVVYVASSIIGHAPSIQRSRWYTANHAAIEDLKTAMAAWYASARLTRDAFRDKFLDPSIPDDIVDDLRAAARGAVEGRSYNDLARAGDHLAAAALSLGPDRWPRFVGGAARNAVAAVDGGTVPGITKVGAADIEGGLAALGGAAVLGGLMYLLSRKPTTQPAPPLDIPSIAENRRPPSDAKDPNGSKAPGKPGATEGFEDPKGGEQWVPNPNGRGFGWLDSKGNVWVPSGPTDGSRHGEPHWDVQRPRGGKYRNAWPGQKLEE